MPFLVNKELYRDVAKVTMPVFGPADLRGPRQFIGGQRWVFLVSTKYNL